MMRRKSDFIYRTEAKTTNFTLVNLSILVIIEHYNFYHFLFKHVMNQVKSRINKAKLIVSLTLIIPTVS
jgi:hypothetical protein